MCEDSAALRENIVSHIFINLAFPFARLCEWRQRFFSAVRAVQSNIDHVQSSLMATRNAVHTFWLNNLVIGYTRCSLAAASHAYSRAHGYINWKSFNIQTNEIRLEVVLLTLRLPSSLWHIEWELLYSTRPSANAYGRFTLACTSPSLLTASLSTVAQLLPHVH